MDVDSSLCTICIVTDLMNVINVMCNLDVQ